MKHPHAELIHAWADGAKIEFQDMDDSRWYPVAKNAPSWGEGTKYRIAPEPKKYRVALFTENTVATANSLVMADEWEKSADFLRWLTPWTEYTPDEHAT